VKELFKKMDMHGYLLCILSNTKILIYHVEINLIEIVELRESILPLIICIDKYFVLFLKLKALNFIVIYIAND
jgi:hypothetical protein